MPPLEEPLSHPLNLTLRGFLGFPGDSVVKNPPANAGDTGLILGLGRSPGEGNGSQRPYSCLEIQWMEEPGKLQSMGSQKRWTRLSD